MIEYLFEGKRRRFTIGILDKQGAAGESISSWLANGRSTLARLAPMLAHGRTTVSLVATSPPSATCT